MQRVTDRTAALVAETEALRQLNPLIDDYGFAVEKARTEQELINAAQKAGVAITPALRAEIAKTAEQWALATAEANKFNEANGRIQQTAQEWRDTERDAIGGVVSDLIAENRQLRHLQMLWGKFSISFSRFCLNPSLTAFLVNQVASLVGWFLGLSARKTAVSLKLRRVD